MNGRTVGQIVGQWLTNLTILIPLLSVLGASTIYGNSETVKEWVHGSNNSPLTIEAVTPEVEPKNYDRIIKEIIQQNKDQAAVDVAQQKQLDILNERHE